MPRQLTERRILLFIAFNGPANKGQIERKIRPKMDHNTIHERVRALSRYGLIHVVGKERIIVRYYEITRAGLMWLIPLLKQSPVLLSLKGPSILARIAEKYHDLLPEILPLWPGIIQARVEDIATWRLERYCAGAFQEEVRARLRLRKRDDRLNHLLRDFWLEPFPEGDLDAERWRQALVGVPALHDATKKALRDRMAELDHLRKMLNV